MFKELKDCNTHKHGKHQADWNKIQIGLLKMKKI